MQHSLWKGSKYISLKEWNWNINGKTLHFFSNTTTTLQTGKMERRGNDLAPVT